MKTPIIYKYKHIQRYQQIIRVLTKHGFGYLVEALHANINFIPFWKKKELSEPAFATAERLRKVLEELGPAFIKLGQLLSTRSDLLPPVYIHQLEQLQDNVQPESFDNLHKIIEHELGKSLASLFQNIEKTPLATASIGQVHRGALLNGEEVVIKVQRSNVAQLIHTDLEILIDIAKYLESRFDWSRRYALRSLADEFSASLRDELDYTMEASSANRLRENLNSFPHIIIPKIYWQFTTIKVLVMQHLVGSKITSIQSRSTPEKKRLARELIEALFKQIMEDGFFHADLHPGNILITEDSCLILMDFGLMGRIDSRTRDQLAKLLIGIVRKDLDGVVSTIIHLGAAVTPVDRKGLRREIFYLLDKNYYLALDQIRIGSLLQAMVRISLKYHIIIPRELVAVTRSLILLESLVERLDPTLNWVQTVKPLILKLISQKLAMVNFVQNSVNHFLSWTETLQELPGSIQQVIKKMEDGKIQLTIEHQHFDRFITKLNVIGNRLSFSLIIAAIIIGTSLIAQQTETSFLRRFPLSELGFIIAVLMGLWLLISIIRSGKL